MSAKIGQYIRERDTAQPLRTRAIESANKLFAEIEVKFFQTSHFIERFNLRASKPIEAVSDFELAVRIVKQRYEDAKGKTAALKIKNHVFVFDCTQEKTVRAVTFWWTEAPAEEALKGRGDFQLAYS